MDWETFAQQRRSSQVFSKSKLDISLNAEGVGEERRDREEGKKTQEERDF
jgi:hypothetical protein